MELLVHYISLVKKHNVAHRDIRDFLEKVEDGKEQFFNKHMLSPHDFVPNPIKQTKKFNEYISLFAENEIVDFFKTHLSLGSLQDLFYVPAIEKMVYNQFYLPKECHPLITDEVYDSDARSNRKNKFAKYNTGDYRNDPYTDLEAYSQTDTINENLNRGIRSLLQVGYVPYLYDIMVKLPEEFVIHELMPWHSNYYDWIKYLRDVLPPGHAERKAFFNQMKPIEMEIFLLPPACWSFSEVEGNACDICQSAEWDDLPPEFRCIGSCVGKQCSRMGIGPLNRCDYHIDRPEVGMIPLLSFRLPSDYYLKIPMDLIFRDYKRRNEEEEVSEGYVGLIMGPFAVEEVARVRSKTNYKKRKTPKSLIIVSVFLPPKRNFDSKQPDEIPTPKPEFQDPMQPNLIAVYQFKSKIRRKTVDVTWAHVHKLEPVSLGWLNVDQDIWLDPSNEMGYLKSSVFDYGKITPKLNIRGQNHMLQLWFFFDRLMAYNSTFTIEYRDITRILEKYVTSNLAKQVTDPYEIILFLIEWNVKVRLQYTYHDILSIPLMLFMLPPDNKKNHKWRDVWIGVRAPTKEGHLWRYIPESKDEFTKMFKFEAAPFFPNDSFMIFHSKIKPVKVNVNDILRNEDDFTSVPWDVNLGDLPKGCFSLMESTSDREIDAFIKENEEEKDQPFVFIQTTSGGQVFASCMTKSTLEQMGSQDTARFYECIKDAEKYVVPEQEYIKLNIFNEFQTFITKQNYEFLLKSDNVYFRLEPTTFYYLPYSMNVALYHNRINVSDEDAEAFLENDPHLTPEQNRRHARAMAAVVGTNHCQANSDVHIYSIVPIERRGLDLGTQRKQRKH